MTLLSALRATKVLVLAAALVTGGMTAADAGDGLRHRNHDHHSRQKLIPRLDQNASRSGFGTVLRHSESRQTGGQSDPDFYAGGFVSYRDAGSGLSFYVNDGGGYGWSGQPAKRSEAGPKVITVMPGYNECSWEAGVCVIRPGH